MLNLAPIARRTCHASVATSLEVFLPHPAGAVLHRPIRDRPEHDFAGGGQTLIDALAAPSRLVQLTEHQGG